MNTGFGTQCMIMENQGINKMQDHKLSTEKMLPKGKV